MGEAQSKDGELAGALAEALELVTAALARLDEAGAPADIGAHLDLALHRMSRISV